MVDVVKDILHDIEIYNQTAYIAPVSTTYNLKAGSDDSTHFISATRQVLFNIGDHFKDSVRTIRE